MIAGDDARRGGASPVPGPANTIGPNAVTQLRTVLLRESDAGAVRSLFDAAGISAYLDRPPRTMVDERDVARLHRAVRARFAGESARRLMTAAGDATGRYILAHRIPAPVTWLLRRLRPRWSSRLLAAAIGRHAWTFAGSGTFSIDRRRYGSEFVATAAIRANPVVALDQEDHPICDWHAAVFLRLYRDLVSSRARVSERRCCAAGDDACTFEIRFPVR